MAPDFPGFTTGSDDIKYFGHRYNHTLLAVNYNKIQMTDDSPTKMGLLWLEFVDFMTDHSFSEWGFEVLK